MPLFDDVADEPGFKDLSPEVQRRALSLAFDEDLKEEPDYATADQAALNQVKEQYLDDYLTPDRGFFGDVASRVARGTVGGIGATAAGISTMGSDTAEDVYQWSQEKLEDAPFLQPDKGERRGEEGYVYRSLMGAAESVPQSIGPLLAGVGVGLLAGPVAGTVVGTGAVINAFGLGQARKSTDEARDWLTKNRTDLSPDEIESMASKKGIEDGLWEAIPELGGNLVTMLTAGGGLAFKQPLVTTLKTLLRPQNFAKKFLVNALGEVSTEEITSLGQKYAAEKVGMPAPNLWEAVKEPFLSSVFMSLAMGQAVDLYSYGDASRVFKNINAEGQDGKFDKGKRTKTADEVIRKIEDPEVRQAWAKIAAGKIEANEQIDIDLPLVDFGAQKAQEEKGPEGLHGRLSQGLAEGKVTPNEVREQMPELLSRGISSEQIKTMLEEIEGPESMQSSTETAASSVAEQGGDVLAQASAVADAQSQFLASLPPGKKRLALPPGQGFEAPGLAPSTRGEEAPVFARGHTPVVEMGPGPITQFEPPPEWTRGHRPALEADQAPVAAPLTAPPAQTNEDPTYREAFTRATDSGAPEALAREYAQEALALENRAVAAGIPRSMREETTAAEMESFLAKDKAGKKAQGSTVAAFTEEMNPLRAKVEKTLLERKVKHEGETRSRRDLIEAGVAEGGTVIKVDGKRRLRSPDGSVLTEKQTTKPGMDYAEFIIKESTDGQVQETKVEQAKEASQEADVLAKPAPPEIKAVLFAEAKPGDLLVSDREQYLIQKGIKTKREASSLADSVNGSVVLDKKKWAVVSDAKPGAAEVVTPEVEAATVPAMPESPALAQPEIVPEAPAAEVKEPASQPTGEKQPWEMTRKEYREALPPKKPNEVFYIKSGGRNIEAIQNPTSGDLGQLAREVREEFPDMPKGDVKVRFTQDAYGNRYAWKASQAMHQSIEPILSKRVGEELNQNAGRPTHRREVQEAIIRGESIPREVLAEYPADLVPKELIPKTTEAKGPADQQDISKITVRRPGIEETTNDDIEVEKNAKEELQLVDNKLTALDKLRNCLRA